jgi:hypothetical protein
MKSFCMESARLAPKVVQLSAAVTLLLAWRLLDETLGVALTNF